MFWAERQFTTHPASTHATVMWALDDELANRNIEIPFPQRDLHFRSGTLDVSVSRKAPATETQADAPDGQQPKPATGEA